MTEFDEKVSRLPAKYPISIETDKNTQLRETTKILEWAKGIEPRIPNNWEKMKFYK